MVVFDVTVDGVLKETIRPANQRLREMYWCVVDRFEQLKVKYGDNISVQRRIVYER